VIGVSSSGPLALPAPPATPKHGAAALGGTRCLDVLAAVHGLGPVGLAALLAR
jgi:threonine dehydrogenase-like Zn-dependent dehydrogenase